MEKPSGATRPRRIRIRISPPPSLSLSLSLSHELPSAGNAVQRKGNYSRYSEEETLASRESRDEERSNVRAAQQVADFGLDIPIRYYRIARPPAGLAPRISTFLE